MAELLGTPLFGPVTIGHVAGALLAILVIGALLKIFRKGPVEAKHLVQRRCPACGWSGSVSKFNLTCPKCAKKL